MIKLQKRLLALIGVLILVSGVAVYYFNNEDRIGTVVYEVAEEATYTFPFSLFSRSNEDGIYITSEPYEVNMYGQEYSYGYSEPQGEYQEIVNEIHLNDKGSQYLYSLFVQEGMWWNAEKNVFMADAYRLEDVTGVSLPDSLAVLGTTVPVFADGAQPVSYVAPMQGEIVRTLQDVRSQKTYDIVMGHFWIIGDTVATEQAIRGLLSLGAVPAEFPELCVISHDTSPVEETAVGASVENGVQIYSVRFDASKATGDQLKKLQGRSLEGLCGALQPKTQNLSHVSSLQTFDTGAFVFQNGVLIFIPYTSPWSTWQVLRIVKTLN